MQMQLYQPLTKAGVLSDGSAFFNSFLKGHVVNGQDVIHRLQKSLKVTEPSRSNSSGSESDAKCTV